MASGRQNQLAAIDTVELDDSQAVAVTDAAIVAEEADLPLTISRTDLLTDRTDRDFRQFVHRLLAFSARLETIRSGFGSLIGLSGIQYSALIAIAHLSRDQDVGVKEVADHLALSGSFATLVIGQLTALGLVSKETNPDDRRRVCLTVTKKGRALLADLAPIQRQVNDLLFEPLDGEAFRQMNVLFSELVSSGDSAVSLVAYLAEFGIDGHGETRARGRSGTT